MPINVHRITDAWTENGVNWNNTGADFDSGVQGSFVAPNDNIWVSVDLQALVESWVNGAFPNDGVMLISTSDDNESKFASKEWSTVSERPCMEVIPVCTP